ncbi:MAG: DMT family transporter [Proteobacteria bacterium]|nr:DMT family transporter [Pseudomonadota bacterium]MBU1739316.1 DMT family transporter [Pseudomonadota bacterium]
MGIIFMLLASASFATMAAMLKGLGPELPLAQMVFLRCAIAVPFFLAVLLHQGRPLLVRARRVLLWRTLFGMLAMFCFFYALTHMELASCIFIGRAQPLLLALLAPLVLDEKAPGEAWLAILTGLAGVALIMNPKVVWSFAALIAFVGAFFSAGAHLMVRRLNQTDHPLVIVFNFTLLTGVLTAVWSLPGYVPLLGKQWLLVVGVAFFASLGQIFMTSAYRRDRAPAVAAASYSSVILSVVYGYYFWGELPGPMTWVGGGLIFTGGMLLVRSRYRCHEPVRNPGKQG